MVSVAQNAFVAGRQIWDASLLAYEIVGSMLRIREKGILCKLDIEKSYDNVSWDYLLKIMRAKNGSVGYFGVYPLFLSQL